MSSISLETNKNFHGIETQNQEIQIPSERNLLIKEIALEALIVFIFMAYPPIAFALILFFPPVGAPVFIGGTYLIAGWLLPLLVDKRDQIKSHRNTYYEDY